MNRVVYKVNNPGFIAYPREQIFKEDEPTIAPFTEVEPPMGAYLPWFDFDKNQWEETADDKWVGMINNPEPDKLTPEEALDRIESLTKELESLKDSLS